MPSATFTASSGSERVVRVYPPRPGPASSGGSASIHSPSSSDPSISSDSSWQHLDADGEDDDPIEPSDSASRLRGEVPARVRRKTDSRPPPTRRHSSRRIIVAAAAAADERDESPPPRERRPRRRSTHNSTSRSHHRRNESRRTPSDESGSVASYEEYLYSHHGAPQPPRPYPSGYRHVPAPGHGGYPPSVTSAAGGYMDPFTAAAAHQQAMVHMPQDPFGLPANPFSPLSTASGATGYFEPPLAPPPPPSHTSRPPGAPRPASFVAPPSHYGSEMAMAPFAYSPAAFFPPPWAYPPPSKSSTPAPPPAPAPAPSPDPVVEKFSAEIDALKAALTAKDDEAKAKTAEEIENLKAMIKKYEEAQIAAEKAAAAKKAEEEAEKRKKEEIAAAAKKAKEEAEKKAEEAAKKAQKEHEEAAKKAQQEHEEKLAEAKKAQEEAEKKAKEAEEEAKKFKPSPDATKAPVLFKDVLGRKFSFPWHLCKTWKGMEALIKHAFLHIAEIGEQVQMGHYDLTGPDGEIILPQVWDTVLQPGWEISMHIWPKEEKADEIIDPLGGLYGDLGIVDVPLAPPPKPKAPKKSKDGSKKKNKATDVLGAAGMSIPPPPNFPPGMMPDPLIGYQGDLVDVVVPPPPPQPQPKKSKSAPKKTQPSSFGLWLVGGKPSKRK